MPLVSQPTRPSRPRPGDGAGMLLVFVAATLVMVVAVVITALVDHWWVLVPVMAFYLALTFDVTRMITRLLGQDGEVPEPEAGGAATRWPTARR